MEKELRKCESPSGTWVRLGDGDFWCVPALPLGKACEGILTALETLYEIQETQVAEVVADAVGETPALPTAKSLGAKNKKLMVASADFAYLLIRVNYPELTREQFDEANLVTLQHCNIFQRIVQGGTGLGEIIGETEPGEAKTATA